MANNISGLINSPQSPGFAPALNGIQPQIQDYQMRMYPSQQSVQIAPVRVPYNQWLNDNKQPDSMINKLLWMRGLKPGQEQQLMQ